MNYGDHNFIEITQQTKLRVEPVELVVSSVSSRVEPSWFWPYAVGLMLCIHYVTLFLGIIILKICLWSMCYASAYVRGY